MAIKPIDSTLSRVVSSNVIAKENLDLSSRQNQVTDDAAKIEFSNKINNQDNAKIDSLKSAIENGTYNPSSVDIAKSIIKELL